MELQAFIEESLKQIMKGVANAGAIAREHGAEINPHQRRWRYGEGIYFDNGSGRVLANVEFHVAVTAMDGTNTKGGIGVAIANVVLGSQGESSRSSQHLSRLKFSLPVVFPSTSVNKQKVVS